jgi:hypothetical protein
VKPELLVLAGGAFNLAFAVFHVFFWKMFRWKTELARLSALNRAVVQVLNLCLTFAFLIFAYLSFFHVGELLSGRLGRSLLLLVAVFWYLRALEQAFFFGVRKPLSIFFLVVFLLGGSLYLGALLWHAPA